MTSPWRGLEGQNGLSRHDRRRRAAPSSGVLSAGQGRAAPVSKPTTSAALTSAAKYSKKRCSSLAGGGTGQLDSETTQIPPTDVLSARSVRTALTVKVAVVAGFGVRGSLVRFGLAAPIQVGASWGLFASFGLTMRSGCLSNAPSSSCRSPPAATESPDTRTVQAGAWRCQCTLLLLLAGHCLGALNGPGELSFMKGLLKH